MPQPKDTVSTIHFKGYTNTRCEFMPCHKGVKDEFNCLFCYCPLVFLECPGPFAVFTDKNGLKRKDCSNCKLPHDGYERSWNFIQKALEHPVPWNGKWSVFNMRVEDILQVKTLQSPESGDTLMVTAFEDETFHYQASGSTELLTMEKNAFLKAFKSWTAAQ